jgi:hypothetical protein
MPRERLAPFVLHLHVRERRVPGDVNMAGKQRLDLPFVIGEQRKIHGRAGLVEVVADPFPNGDDFRIVGDGAEQDRFVHAVPKKEAVR